jgi:hypothetical protein
MSSLKNLLHDQDRWKRVGGGGGGVEAAGGAWAHFAKNSVKSVLLRNICLYKVSYSLLFSKLSAI